MEVNDSRFQMGQHKSRLKAHTQAAKQGDLRALQQLLTSSDFDVNCIFDTDQFPQVCPLWLAAQHGDLELLQLLLRYNANVNQRCGSLQMSPLHIAAYNHHVEVVAALLHSGADPNVLDCWNYSPLMYTAIYHEPFSVNSLSRLLIQYGCNVNLGATLDDNGDPESQHFNMEMQHLSNYSDSCHMSYIREPLGPTSGTALHLAVQNPHLPNESVEILLNAGALVNKRNLLGQTALMAAVSDIYFDYHKDVIAHTEALLNAGADTNICDCQGWASFHYAAQRGSIKCMEMLMKRGADCNIHSEVGETPLWLLLIHGWQDAASYLIQSGCELNNPLRTTSVLAINNGVDVCRYGPISPMEFALCNGYYGLAVLMIKVGCKMDHTTWLGPKCDPPSPKDLDFQEFVESARTPRLYTLKELCRTCIRNSMQQRMAVNLEKLNVPRPLQAYILYADN